MPDLVTEITAGLDAGTTVVLADLDAAIDSGEAEADTGLAGLGGDQSTGRMTPPTMPEGGFPG